ncbi:MAG: phage tail tape measure protein [Lachnospira sp.]|nr:phage tail tape measure protein [Lachnospira sp.]
MIHKNKKEATTHMDKNDFLIQLQAVLDSAKSKKNINADIKKLQGSLDGLKLRTDISPDTDALNGTLKETEKTMTASGKFGTFLKDQLSQAAQGFKQWLSAGSAVNLFLSGAKNAVSELKQMNGMLADISKAAGHLTKTDLSALSRSAFDTAGRYGRKAPDYLSSVLGMYRAGYGNAGEMAELSLLAQAAGDMDAGLAESYLTATDAAYRLRGSIAELNAVLDGQNHIASRNALSMGELASATAAAASHSAESGVSIDRASAAMAAMMAVTHQGGNAAANAFQNILMHLRQIQGEAGDGEIIDAESLRRCEQACEALGVSLKEVRAGTLSLRDPMQVLEELSNAYTALEESDPRRAGLTGAFGGGDSGLRALLENWSLYEKMLDDYASGGGSAMEAAAKSADDWEGSVNRLGNTFAKVMGNLVHSDAVTTAADALNGLLSPVDAVTAKLGPLGAVGLAAGLSAGVRNTGKRRMSVRIS